MVVGELVVRVNKLRTVGNCAVVVREAWIPLTGVRIIGPIGIGEVKMTTFFYRKKSKKSENKWFSFGDWMGI